jgi:hypothetical protein
LKSGLVKTPNTLMVIATTAGRGQENLGYQEYEYARKVATGEVIDPSYLPIIFEADAKTTGRMKPFGTASIPACNMASLIFRLSAGKPNKPNTGHPNATRSSS